MASENADPLFWNKIIGAVLTTGIIVMGSGFVADLLVAPQHMEASVYAVAPPQAPGDGGAAEAQAAGPEPVAALLAAADVGAGQKLSKKCGACHSFKKDDTAKKPGPNLWGVVGRDLASVGGFGYSKALAGVGGAWGYEELNVFLLKPKEFAPGTKMAFAGLKKAHDRANLIAWLRTLSDSPRPLP